MRPSKEIQASSTSVFNETEFDSTLWDFLVIKFKVNICQHSEVFTMKEFAWTWFMYFLFESIHFERVLRVGGNIWNDTKLSFLKCWPLEIKFHLLDSWVAIFSKLVIQRTRYSPSRKTNIIEHPVLSIFWIYYSFK